MKSGISGYVGQISKFKTTLQKKKNKIKCIRKHSQNMQ